MGTRLWTGIVLSGAMMIVGCSNDEQEVDLETAAEANSGSSNQSEVDVNTPAAVTTSTPNLERAKLYRFSDAGTGATDCQNSPPPGLSADDIRCAGESDWKWLCENARLIGKEAAKTIVANTAFDESPDAYRALEFLIDNQQISGNRISWERDGEESCKISFTISGQYGGSYYNKNGNGYATEILLNPQGMSFIYSGSKEYEF